MRNVTLHPEAEQEAWLAAEYLNEQRSNYGKIFNNELRTAFRQLANTPERWSVQLHGYRKYTVQRFGYQIWYKEQGDELFVIAVHHGSREPGYWKHRVYDE